ncbi:general secretion pathway protein F [Janthinobacterium sp. CG_23.3]|uniref:type II secretion system F family protein n=1 Tax=Janthinobacterium sp. CG_23.3 TaxID=3349634 RepID=UPI0038D3663E
MDFNLKVYHPLNGVTRLRCVAADEAGARSKAAEQGMTVLSLSASRLRWRAGGASRFKVQLFGQELLALLDAGMGLVEAIAILIAKNRDPEARQVLQRIHVLLLEGQTLSNALAGAPDTFPTLFVATVKASEQTGNLPEALRRYLAYFKQLNSVRDKVVSASIYPALLLAVGALVVVFLLSYVVPRFGSVYADLGTSEVPFLSRLLIEWGGVVKEHGVEMLAGSLALAALAAYLFSRPALKAALQRLLWRLPHLGEQIRTYQLARFTRTVAMLINGGVPLVTALDMTDALLQQPALRAGLQAARTAIREGGALAEAFREHGLATEIGVRLLVVGERGGKLGETMEKIAAFYDEEIARELDWFSKLFEPLLMTFIGCLIGGIVILMYLPIFDLAGNIK